jgi:hypothetical protein
MLVDARDDGEKLLLTTRKNIDSERAKLAEEITQKNKETLEAATKAAAVEVLELRENEKKAAEAIRESGKSKIKEAGKVVLSALLQFADSK